MNKPFCGLLLGMKSSCLNNVLINLWMNVWSLMLNFVSSVGHLYIVRKKKDWKGHFGIYQHWAANGQQARQICSMGGKSHSFTAYNNCDLKLRIASATSSCCRSLYQLHSCTENVLFFPPCTHLTWVSSRCPFLYNYHQLICSELTWLPLETTSPDCLFMGFRWARFSFV